jgi:aminopeptidase N
MRLFPLGIAFFVLLGCGTKTIPASTNKSGQLSKETSSLPTKDIETDEQIFRQHYNPSATILTDLIHTQLEVRFDWATSQLIGTATITASPYFYSTDSLILDAKTMDIHSVSINGNKLKYTYNDGLFLRIGLDRTYTRDEQYTVVVKYTAKPNEKVEGGSSAISSDKGLYFINPLGEDPNKMPQIWTQGETEASSVWFPTIDRPNQKMTQEIFMTVDNKYATLSNGRLVSQKDNGDGTRTDHWKQDLPHVPYLAAMAVGEFKVVKDSYTRQDGSKMDVHYYVEPEWEEHAQAIFGETPEMIKFFSELLGVEYPWDKYHQVVVRDYVSGAMENTGAVIFGDFVYKTKRELIDGNDHSIIAHELFHHWFGDLVTCESWANLPLNESFANYSQYLWDEHFYGVDEADYNAEKEAQGYYQSAAQMGHHDMIWYDYDEKEDMFDGHSYNKGGRILHMLRNYLGDDAFFKSLQHYLKTHQYKPVEIHHLRLAFEEISGEDLNWFFDQWFFASYHPELKVTHNLDTPDQVTIRIEQKQNLDKAPLYKLPLQLALYVNGEKQTHPILVDKKVNEFTYRFKGTLDNIIIDEQRMLLGSVSYKKPTEFYVHQFYNAPRYKDREEGLTFGSRLKGEQGAQLIFDALKDDFWVIREAAIGKLKKIKRDREQEVFEQLTSLVDREPHSRVRAAAIRFLSNEYFDGETAEQVRTLLKNHIASDSSYLVVARSLGGLSNGNDNDLKEVLRLSKEMENEPSSAVRGQVAMIYATHGDQTNLPFFRTTLLGGHVSGYEAIGVMGHFTNLLKQQDLDTQMAYLDVYEQLRTAGGAYIKAVLPMNVMMLKKHHEEQLSKLNSDGGTQEEISKTEALVNRITKILG